MLDRVEPLELAGRELDAHAADFFESDPVLAGNRAADLDAQLQNLASIRLGLFRVARTIGVEQDQWMQVAVAGMEDIHAAQPEFPAELGNSRQHRRDRASRDRSIDAVII